MRPCFKYDVYKNYRVKIPRDILYILLNAGNEVREAIKKEYMLEPNSDLESYCGICSYVLYYALVGLGFKNNLRFATGEFAWSSDHALLYSRDISENKRTTFYGEINHTYCLFHMDDTEYIIDVTVTQFVDDISPPVFIDTSDHPLYKKAFQSNKPNQKIFDEWPTDQNPYNKRSRLYKVSQNVVNKINKDSISISKDSK